jgi:hypothetical protein
MNFYRTSFRLFIILIGLFFSSCVYHDLNILSNDCANSDLAVQVLSVTATTACDATDGTIKVSASGGSGDYTFALGDQAFQTDSIFGELGVGTYMLSVKDNKGCIATELISVNSAETSITLTSTSIDDSGCPLPNGSIVITAGGGQEPYLYQLNSAEFQESNHFEGLAAGNYFITVKDASGCPATANATISRIGPSFVEDIQPIIDSKCAISGCHNGNQSPKLSSYAGVKSNSSFIRSSVTDRSMPPSNSAAGSLSQGQIDLINCWVEDGAINN